MSSRISHTRHSAQLDLVPIVTVGALLLIAVALGGGGVRYAMANLIVQLAAFVVLAVQRGAVFDFWRRAPLALRTLVGLTLPLPVSQLVPLPPSLWMGLPGRDLVAQSFELAGRTGWAPMSVDPVRTLVALTGLITPLAVMVGGWKLENRQLLWLGWWVVGLGLLTFLIGVPQVVSAGNSAMIYERLNSSVVLSGLFANRNSTGVFLVGVLGLAALLPLPVRHPATIWVRISVCVLLVIGIVLTRSRTALVLAAIPLVLAALRALAWSRRKRSADSVAASRTPLIVAGAIALGIAAIGSTIVLAPGRVADTIDRFEATDDARRFIWEDAAFATSRYWPVGTGMGTFDEVFQVDESLENATLRRAGRAHNDYLELAIEAGIVGLALVAMWAALVARLAWRARFSRARWAAWAAASFLLAIALQSITDYPLRNQSLLAIAGFAMLLLARIASDREEGAA